MPSCSSETAGSPVVRRRSQESRERRRARSLGDAWHRPITAHAGPKWVADSAILRAVRRLALFSLFVVAIAGCDSDDGAPPAPGPASFLEAAATPSRRAIARARHAGRGEQVGLLVRALPARVPLLPEPGREARGRDRVPRRELERQPRRRRGLPDGGAGRLPALRGPEPRDRGVASTRSRRSRARPSTTRRASSPSCTRAATRPRSSWRRTSTATPADRGGPRSTAPTRSSPPRSSCASVSSAASRACRSRPTRTAATPRPRTSWPSTTGA